MEIKEGILLKVDNKDFVNGTLTIPEGVKQISDDFSQNSKNLIELEKARFPILVNIFGKTTFSSGFSKNVYKYRKACFFWL